MKIHLLSDIHLEFHKYPYTWEIPVTDADVVVLAGDIGVGKAVVPWMKKEQSRLGKPFIYVLGNHEYYNQRMEVFNALLSESFKDTDIHLLNPGVFRLNGWKFISATLWTDYLLYWKPQKAKEIARHNMADHRLITYRGEPFTPEAALELHNAELDFILCELQEDTTKTSTVVITHHGPIANGVAPRYAGDELTPAFVSDLTSYIHYYKPAAWLFGHTHYSMDMMIGETRVVANQMGYPYESEIGIFDTAKVIELSADLSTTSTKDGENEHDIR